ncbi:MAG TPA: phosphoglycerate kinase [Candidatus Nanoarchaeia archaeon]|nr:phosphoglycerate kinase [Candidatus Nanoarchaeia archaeon]
MRSLKEADVKGRRVLVRVDFNIPLKNGKVVDDKRIRAALPTIDFLRKKKAKVILISHLGRPDGKVVEDLRLEPIAHALSKMLKYPVHHEPDCIGSDVEDRVRTLHDGDVLLLENLRFYPEEEADDDLFAQKLAAFADVYVNDAFGTCHRAHASVHAVTRYLPSYAGFLLEKEVKVLSSLLKNPKRPFVAVMGGAKVSDKIKVIENLLKRVDAILIGGAMMFTFYKALGYNIGKSKFEADKVALAKALLKKGKKKLALPIDVVVALSPKAKGKVMSSRSIPKSMMGLDIGPVTQQIYANIIRDAKTVFWNGPMGMFEVKRFAKGTLSIAKAMAECRGVTVVGGGETVSAVEKLSKKFTHVSTGGGAALEFLEGKSLPGIAALDDNEKSLSDKHFMFL